MADETAPSSKTILGQSRIFTPEVINDIHMKAELGRYRMRGFSMFKPIPHWDELMFMPGTLTRFVIEGYREKCETKTVLGARFAKKPIELDIPSTSPACRSARSRSRRRWRSRRAPRWPARRRARARAG